MTSQSRSSLLILFGSSAFVLIAIVAAGIFIFQNADGNKDLPPFATQVPTQDARSQAETQTAPITTPTMISSPTDTPVTPPNTPSQAVPTILSPTPNLPTPIIQIYLTTSLTSTHSSTVNCFLETKAELYFNSATTAFYNYSGRNLTPVNSD